MNLLNIFCLNLVTADFYKKTVVTCFAVVFYCFVRDVLKCSHVHEGREMW